MLRVLSRPHVVPESQKHEEIFLCQYQQILAWALRLTNQDQQEAEDLTQDAFIAFVHSRPDLRSIRNLDGYFYVFLRNLHRSRLHRLLRRRDILLSVIDYDSAETGLCGIDPGHFLQVWEDLCRVCEFALQRKNTSKAGSILILRFFHGYSVAEVAQVLRSDRGTVDSRLNLVRKEARLYLDDPEKLKVIGAQPTKISLKPAPAGNTEKLIWDLRKLIFAAKTGPCLPEARLKELYRAESLLTPDLTVLAHIVSCRSCLDAVNQKLGLPMLSGRGLDGSEGEPPAMGRSNSSGNGRQPRKDRLAQWRRLASGIGAHHPSVLGVAVNGVPLVWQEVLKDRNEFSLRVQQTDPVEFIEILSEQGVRLVSLLIAELPPEGPCEARNEVALSDGRQLSVSLRFETLWPMVHVSYSNAVAAAAAQAAKAPHDDVAPESFSLRTFARIFQSRVLNVVFVLCLIVAFLFYQTRETTVSAATLLAGADAWEQKSARTGLVTHRSFELDERGAGGSPLLSRRRVEVWQDRSKGKKLRRLYDQAGKLLASFTGQPSAAPLSAADIWKYEPSAESFRLIAGQVSRAKVFSSANRFEVATEDAMLILDRATFQPTAETILLEQREYRFTESSFETIPLEKSPLVNPDVKRARRDGRAPEKPVSQASPSAPTPEELENAELCVRVALHDLSLDLTSSVSIRREPQGIEVVGVVDSRDQKNELASALSQVPCVHLSIATPEQILSDSTAVALATPPSSSTVVPALLHSWLEQRYPLLAERRAYVHRVLSLSHEAVRHGYALDDLAARYPRLDRSEIRRIVEDHQRAIKRTWDRLGELTREMPVMVSPPDGGGDNQAWPYNAKSLALAIERFDSHALKLFADDASLADNAGATTVQSELSVCRDASRMAGSLLSKPLSN